MIIWTPMSYVPKKADKLNLSLSNLSDNHKILHMSQQNYCRRMGKNVLLNSR